VKKEIIHIPHVPAARGNYSPAVAWGDLLFVSGQLPVDPESGLLIEGSLAAQVQRAMLNLQAVLLSAGSDWEHVLKTTVYITDIAAWGEVNRIYGTFFPQNPPARTIVPVHELHYGALIEIDAIAVRKDNVSAE